MASDDFDFDDKAEWSSRNEEIFIRILHEHVKMGDLDSKTTFNKKIWSVIDDKLFAETNRRFTEPKLKSKFNRLRKKHREFSDLIKHPGFDWNPVTNTITAPDSVWAAYVKVCTVLYLCYIIFSILKSCTYISFCFRRAYQV